jgi:Na+-translocating ferredoxin:NAD+ oxidoreductase RnfD subunit
MAQLGKLMVSSSPHITGKATVKGIMGGVLTALAPASLVGVIFFGFYSLLS